MNQTRRTFLWNGTYAGVGISLAPSLPAAAWAMDTHPAPELAPYVTGIKMAATPATAYRAYRSKPAASADVTTWVQVDLGKLLEIEAVQLLPAAERGYPGRDGYYYGEAFPLRFRIEACEDPEFIHPRTIADFTRSDFPDPADNITRYSAHPIRARYVRVTATRLRSVLKPYVGDTTPGLVPPPQQSPEYTLMIAKMEVLSAGRDVAVGCKTSADDLYGSTDLLAQLTRQIRQDGEAVRFDNPHRITDPSGWKPAPGKVSIPRSGVTLDGGLFQTAMKNNIQYLLESFTTEDLLRQFYERTGKIKNFTPQGPQIFWEEDLAGSNAGRFLMGAGNTLRWINDPELRRRLNVVVDGIEECRQENGYIMAYPEDTIFYSERAGYTRAWLTHGLLEAAYAGNRKALPLLRGYYDWFNRQSFLPEMLRGTPQGGQGMIASTRLSLSSAGTPADAHVIQRYFQEDGWLERLAAHDPRAVWQYPYDRPHCYLLTNLEAYLDLFLLTGELRYRNAALGGWDLYHTHWQQAGGSISIIEFETAPPDSNYLYKKLGELCGSSFWVFLSQRLQMLNPEDERYAAEIERSIYNVGLANQDGAAGFRYHTMLEGKKENATRMNTCCEGQGTRLIASLPEHIYSIAQDGLYIHLFEASTIRWDQEGEPVELHMKTEFPYRSEVEAVLKTASPRQINLHVRIPSWAASRMTVYVNGKPAGTGEPGSYLSVDRHWSNGDAIHFTLPASIRVTPYKGQDQIAGKMRYSIEYGPILLAAIGTPPVNLVFDEARDLDQIASRVQLIPDSRLQFSVSANPGQILMPYWQISNEEFSCHPTITAHTQHSHEAV